MKTKKKSGKTLRKSGKSQGKIREFDGIKKVGTLFVVRVLHNRQVITYFKHFVYTDSLYMGNEMVTWYRVKSLHCQSSP